MIIIVHMILYNLYKSLITKVERNDLARHIPLNYINYLQLIFTVMENKSLFLSSKPSSSWMTS